MVILKITIINFLIFSGGFFLIALLGVYIFLIFYNRKSRAIIEKFLSQSKELKPIIFRSLKLRYWVTNNARIMLSPNNYCDLFVFDKFISIIRRQNFIFKVYFAPALITNEIRKTKDSFNYLDIYKPEQITFKKIVVGEVDIKLRDQIHRHYKIDITLKGLTNEQIDQLSKIKNWNQELS